MTTTSRAAVLLTTAAAMYMGSWSGTHAQAPTPATRAAAHVDRNTVLLRAPQLYQSALQSTTSSWEQFKSRLEARRNDATIDDVTYQALMADYTRGVGASTEGLSTVSPVARGAAERVPERTEAPTARAKAQRTATQAETPARDENVAVASRLVASEALLADAEVRLRIASRRDGQDVDVVAAEAKAAMMTSLSSPDAAAVRSYVQSRFPMPVSGEDWAAFAARMNEFSSGLSMLMSRGPIVADLRVQTSPTGATVEIHPLYTPTLSRTAQTEASFENLYLGLYRIKVSLPGHRDYDNELNFLDDLQPTLDCAMAPVTPTPDSTQTTCQRRRP